MSGFSRTVRALVLELVEGETLADRIARGPIPVDDALAIAKQIAEALETAHEQGIIHRDLKPANIKVRPDGTVKVLDFGLAKALSPPALDDARPREGTDLTAEPTITSPVMITGVGVLLGTAAYMSPEQARGKPVDKRTDIWAFGCVLYEMLTGRRAFEDEDVSLTLSKVLQREPDFDGLPADTPARVRQVVHLCLRKPLKARVPDIGAVRLALEGAFDTTSSQSGELWPPAVLRLWQRPLPAGLILVAVAIMSGFVVWREVRPEAFTTRVARFEITLAAAEVLGLGSSDHDPSGHIVYAADSERLAVPFDAERLQVTGSPVPVVRGVVTKPGGAADFALAMDGTLVYVPGEANSESRKLVWVDRTGREEPLPAPERGYVYPRVSPDGTRVAIDVRDQGNDIWTWDFARQTLTRLTSGGAADTYPVWSPDSQRLTFGSSRAGAVMNLLSQAADGSGEPERLSESPNGQQAYAITPDGTRIVVRENRGLQLMSLAPPRRAEPVIEAASNAEISPNGRWLAYESDESGRDEIYVRTFPDISKGRWQVSTDGGQMPLWSRNGRELFYLSPDGAIMGISTSPDPGWRSSKPVPVFHGQYVHDQYAGRTFDIGPDGRFLMIKESRPDGAASQNRIVFVQNWSEELKRLVPRN